MNFDLVAKEPFRAALIMRLNFDALTLAHKAEQAYTFQLKQLPLQNHLCKVIIKTYVRL